MKEKIIETIDDYVEDAKEVGRLLKEKYNRDLNNPKIRNRYLIIASVGLVITILIANIFTSRAYYYQDTEGALLIQAKVGRMYIDDYDYTLLVFVESDEDESFFKLTESIPSSGYTYNGYSCLNNSTLLYDDGNKITRATIREKDVCSVYFRKS